jgi:hypothetical protein
MVRERKGKRTRDNAKDQNKRPTKRTKIQENQESLFDTLHDELIINILIQIPMRFFPDLGRTCRRWTNLCQKQDFWRLYAIKQWGQNIAPNQLVKNSTGSVEVDLSTHLIPTIQIGTQQVVDWFRYCKIRKLFAHVKRGLQLVASNLDDDRWEDYFGSDDPDSLDEYVRGFDFESHDSLEDYVRGFDYESHDSLEEYVRGFDYGPSEFSEEDYNLYDDDENIQEDLEEILGGNFVGNNNNNVPKNDQKKAANNNKVNTRKKNGDEEKSSSDSLNSEIESLSGDYVDNMNEEEGEPNSAFKQIVQDLVDAHKKETDSQPDNQDDLELTTDNLKNFIVDLPITPSFDFSEPHFLPKTLFEFLYEVSPMVFSANNLCMTSKHMVEVMKNLCEQLYEKGERFAQKYYERMLAVTGKTKLMFDLFLCSCRMFLQLKGVDEPKKSLFKKLLQTMIDIIPPLLNFDIELELQDLLKNEFSPGEATTEEVVGKLIPEIRNALQNTRVLQESLPKTCDMTRFRYPSREIAEKSLTTKDPICPLITPTAQEFEVFNEILAHFIIDKFISAEDLTVKAAALALLEVSWHRTYELWSSILPILCEAAQHDYDEISFAGFVALFKFSEDKQIVAKMTKKQVVMAVEAVIKGIAKFPESAIYLVKIMARLARAGIGNGEFISEKLLDEFHEQLLTVMFDQPKLFLNPIVSKEPTKYFSSFWKLGLVFKDRLGKYLPKFREAFLHLAVTKFDTSVIIANIKAHPNVVPEEYRLLQYILLGNAALGDKFDAEAEDFVKHLQKQKKIKIDKQKFTALFGDVICRMNQKNNKKLKKIMATMLAFFSSEMYEFGISSAVENYVTIGEDYQTFKTIPFTSNQFQAALKVYEARKGRRSGKNMKLQSMFEYDPPPVKKEKAIKKSDKIRRNLNGVFEEVQKYTAYFGNASYSQQKQELTTLASKAVAKNLVLVLENIADEDILELQRAFHLILAFLREGSAPASYFAAAMKIFEKLKPDLLIENQRRYMQIIALVISQRIDSKEKMTNELKEVLLDIYEKILHFYETHIDDRHIVNFLLIFGQCYKGHYPNEKPMMVYNLLKRVLTASPKDTRRALMLCNTLGKFFAEPPEDNVEDPWFIERLHILAFIGYHYGVAFLKRISHFRVQVSGMTYDVMEIFAKCVEYYKDAKDMDVDLQNYMKRFIVLFTVTQMESVSDHVKDLNLFNSVFFEEEEPQKAMDFVRKKSFDTGIKELNKEAKTWQNIFDV